MNRRQPRGHRVFAAGYDRMMAALEHRALGEQRAHLLGDLTGTVLDLGAGTGVNLAYLRSATRIVAAEPDPAMRGRLAGKLDGAHAPVELLAAGAESLPLADDSVDAVVFSLVLCTIAAPADALREARRVLRPGGRLVALEHVRGTGLLARWQDLVTPLFSLLAGGCRPNRDTRAAIVAAGFGIEQEERFDVPLPLVPARPWISVVAS